jgi:Clostripain family
MRTIQTVNTGGVRRRSWTGLIVAGVLLAGCSGSDGSTTTEDTTASAAGERESDVSQPIEEAPSTESSPQTTLDAEPPAAPEGTKPWTVLVYSIADTDLEPFMMADINELGTVGTNEHLNLVALVDRAVDYGSDPVLDLGDWQGAKLIEVGAGTGTVLEDYGDLNTGDPQVLADFIANGIASYPAEHYSLVISDHGASWPGVGGDESSDYDSLSLQEINDAITQGLNTAGVDQLDLLGFDACLMATYEVASQLAPLAQRMIASQELEPGHGWDYNSFNILASGDPVDVDTLGAELLDGYRAQAKAEGTANDITLSLIDLTQMGALDTAVADFSAALAERAAQLAPIVGTVRENTLGFGKAPDPAEDSQMADLGHLVSQIGVEALDVSDQADAVIRSLNDVVLRSVEGPASLKSTGLSVYFPPTQDLFNADYDGVVGQSPWSQLLASYYGAGASIPAENQPQFIPSDTDTSPAPQGGTTATADVTSEGVTLTGALDPATSANITKTTMSYGVIEEDGSITFLGEEAATFVDDGSNTVSGFYDFTTFTMSDGEDTFTAYLELDIDEESGLATIDIPMAYYAADDVDGETYQDVLLSITLEAETFDILDETYYVYNERLGTYGELTADPEGIIVPEVLVLAADGTASWEPTSDVGLFADLPGLEYDFVPLASGTRLYVELSVVDFGGNIAVANAEVAVP